MIGFEKLIKAAMKNNYVAFSKRARNVIERKMDRRIDKIKAKIEQKLGE